MSIAAAGAWISFVVYLVIPPVLFASWLPHSEGLRSALRWLGGAYFLAAAFVLHVLLSGYAALWTCVFLLWLLHKGAPPTHDDRQL